MTTTYYQDADCTVPGFTHATDNVWGENDLGINITYTMTNNHQEIEVIRPIKPSYPKARKNKRRNFLKHK